MRLEVKGEMAGAGWTDSLPRLDAVAVLHVF